MEITLKVELGPETLKLIALLAGIAGSAAPKTEAPKVDKPTAPKTEAPKVDKPTAPKTEKPKANDFDDLDDDAKLEAIKSEVTRHTKKGKSADIKALLTHFSAARASELEADKYGDFYNAIVRYGKGESIADITGGEDDLS